MKTEANKNVSLTLTAHRTATLRTLWGGYNISFSLNYVDTMNCFQPDMICRVWREKPRWNSVIAAGDKCVTHLRWRYVFHCSPCAHTQIADTHCQNLRIIVAVILFKRSASKTCFWNYILFKETVTSPFTSLDAQLFCHREANTTLLADKRRLTGTKHSRHFFSELQNVIKQVPGISATNAPNKQSINMSILNTLKNLLILISYS